MYLFVAHNLIEVTTSGKTLIISLGSVNEIMKKEYKYIYSYLSFFISFKCISLSLSLSLSHYPSHSNEISIYLSVPVKNLIEAR